MNLVRISASAAVLRELPEIADLELRRSSVVPLEDDRYQISAYASDEAIEQARARGAEVAVLYTARERMEHLERQARQARAAAADLDET